MTSDSLDTYTGDTRRHLSAVSGVDSASFVGACPERSRRNALGRRISKTISGTTTQFLYDGLNPVQELNGNGGVVANMLTGLNIDEYFTRTEPACCGPLSYLTDALGSTVALADSNGVIQDQYQYEPFGNTYPTTYNNTSTNPYQFTGRENDGFGFLNPLYYYRGRYYSPTFQRFISQDPIDFAGGDANLYAYVSNRPTELIDPLGLTWQTNTEFLWDFLVGTGATNRNYGPNDVETREIMQSPGARGLRNFFYSHGCAGVRNFTYGTKHAALDTLLALNNGQVQLCKLEALQGRPQSITVTVR